MKNANIMGTCQWAGGLLPIAAIGKSTWLSIKVELTLGNPKQQCAGVGICYVETAGHSSARPTTHCLPVGATLLRIGSQQLRCVIDMGQVLGCIRQRHFSGSVFSVPTAVTLNKEISERLGFTRPIKIAVGDYPLLRAGNLVWMVLSVK